MLLYSAVLYSTVQYDTVAGQHMSIVDGVDNLMF